MIKVLVDTDIIIDFLRTGKGNLPKLYELQSQGKIELYTSSITVMELFAGQSSKRISLNIVKLISTLKVIDITSILAKFAGELKRDYNLSVSIADLLVGASALSVRAKIATRNHLHFQGIPNLKFY